jgi:thymidylate kinase
MGTPEVGRTSGTQGAPAIDMEKEAQNTAKEAYKKLVDAERSFTSVLRNNPTEGTLNDALKRMENALNAYNLALKNVKQMNQFIRTITSMPL